MSAFIHVNFVADADLKLGPCCICNIASALVRNVVMLDRLSPIQGHGWGCVVCNLPPHGATAVVCETCFKLYRAGDVELRYACTGYAGVDGRTRIDDLTGSYEHDPVKHAADLVRSG